MNLPSTHYLQNQVSNCNESERAPFIYADVGFRKTGVTILLKTPLKQAGFIGLVMLLGGLTGFIFIVINREHNLQRRRSVTLIRTPNY